MDIAAVRGSLEMLGMIHAKVESLLCSSRAMDGAAEEGHLLVVKYLDANRAKCSRSAVDLAARNGHVEVVRYLVANWFEGGSPYSLLWATLNGHADVVRCLLSMPIRFDMDLCMSVARHHGYVSIVDLLEVHRSESEDGALKWSSASNRRRRAQNRAGARRDVMCSLHSRFHDMLHSLGRRIWPDSESKHHEAWQEARSEPAQATNSRNAETVSPYKWSSV